MLSFVVKYSNCTILFEPIGFIYTQSNKKTKRKKKYFSLRALVSLALTCCLQTSMNKHKLMNYVQQTTHILWQYIAAFVIPPLRILFRSLHVVCKSETKQAYLFQTSFHIPISPFYIRERALRITYILQIWHIQYT